MKISIGFIDGFWWGFVAGLGIGVIVSFFMIVKGVHDTFIGEWRKRKR